MEIQSPSDFIRHLMYEQQEMRHEHGPADPIEIDNFLFTTEGANAEAWLAYSEEEIANRIMNAEDKKQEVEGLLLGIHCMLKEQQSVFLDQLGKILTADQARLNELLQARDDRLLALEEKLKNESFLKKFGLIFDSTKDAIVHREVINKPMFGANLVFAFTAAAFGVFAGAIAIYRYQENNDFGAFGITIGAALAAATVALIFCHTAYNDWTRDKRDNENDEIEYQELVP